MTKIDLIFSTSYDSFVYKKNNNLFNKKFVGEMQLLGFLERELGLSGEFKTNKERQAEYLEYVTKEIDGEDVFISESFKNDNIGVANELLRWRDQLKLCNWNFEKGISVRLNLLADIEAKNDLSLGVSDRWLLVLIGLKSIDTLSIGSIEINDELDLLHPIFKKMFDLLKLKGVAVSSKTLDLNLEDGTNLSKIKKSIFNNETEIELNKSDTSFQVIRFKDGIIASDFLAQQLNSTDLSPVIINSNNSDLDTSFLAYNMPLSGSEITNANPQIIQIFKLVSTLLFSKVNPYNLLSLFNLPALPFAKGLAIKLSRVLINNAGIGNEEWEKTINQFKAKMDKSQYNWSQQLKAIEFYIERKREDHITKENLISIYRDLATWSATMLSISNSDNKRTQFFNLKIFSESLIKTIESINKDIFTASELDKITSKIYEPISIRVNEKEKGSRTVINAPSQLYNHPEVLVWFDFYNCDLSASFCDFLLQSEIQELKKQDNILYWDKENQIELQLNNLKKGVLKTEKTLYLFVSENLQGATTREHPIFTHLSASINNFDEFIHEFSIAKKDINNFNWSEPNYVDIDKIKLPTRTNYVQINNGNLLKKRFQESYSSIDNLIQYPIDWVLNYQARITDKGLGNIDQLMTLKGNLSHMVVQTLLEKGKIGELNLSIINIDSEIDVLLEQFTPQIASPFFLDENKIEYKAFNSQLKRSVKVLLEIIKTNSLIFDSFEHKAMGKINGVDFSGNIDLLFYKGKTPVIIDLKWTYSSSKYFKILKEEKSIQLSIYAKLLQNSSSITGCFLLTDAVLCTTSNQLLGEGIKTIDLSEDTMYVNDRVMKKTMNSFNYRLEELKEGKIESAEDMPLDSVQYHVDTIEKELISLDGDGKTKKVNPYSDYELFKGIIK